MKKFLLLFLLFSNVAYATQSLDKVVAIVDDSVITQSELSTAVQRMKKELGHPTPMPPDSVLQKQALDRLIDRKLEIQLAEQTGIHINDAEINMAITTILQRNKLTMPQFQSVLAKEGMSYKDFRQELRDQITVQRLQQRELGGRIIVTPDEVREFMKTASWQAFNKREYHLEDILIPLSETPSPAEVAEAKQQASDVLAKIHGGMNFSEAAVMESRGNKALQGGDLGWRRLPEIPTEFAELVAHMKKNETAGPILTPNGFHLVKLVDTREIKEGEKAILTDKKQVENLIYQRKLEQASQGWLARLRSEAYINLHPGKTDESTHQ